MRVGYDLAWKNFAILVRYNRQRLYYEQALRDYNIPVAGDSVEIPSVSDSGAEPASPEAASPEVTVEDGVHVETVHASKGLQYAVVYYAGLCEKLTPGECLGNRKARKKQLDEERRLYYVGVTRAEACLFLLYCKRRFWKGKLRRFRRSRFLPKESRNVSVAFMPVILFKIFVVASVLGYMLFYILTLPFTKLYYGKNFNAWLDRKILDFSRFCMKVLRVDLTIEDQAQLGKVDWSRPVFVAGNHNSFADIPIVFLAIQKTVGFVAKKSLGRIPFLHFWMHKIGCILVNREKGGAAKAVREAIAKRGKSVRIFIFPEGTRSKTGALGVFKSGVFRFACENDAILLPLVIKGSGPVAGIKELGPVTLTTGVNATLAPRNLQVRIDSLRVGRLNALGYDYTGIEAMGTYSDQAFDGRIVCDDPNLNALVQGKFDLSPSTRNAAYQFFANVGYADLYALNIDKRGTSKVSLQADANFIRTRDRDLLGEINLRDVQLENAGGRHHIGDIRASAHANDDIHRMLFESGFAEGTFVGDKSLVTLVSDLKDLVVRKELPSLLEKPGAPWSETPYEVNFKFYDTRELLGFILPGMYIEKNSSLWLKVGENGSVDGNITSGRLALGTRYLKDFKLVLDNRNNALRADVTGSAINLGGIELRDNHIDLMVDDDRVSLNYTFDNQTDEISKADLRFTGDLTRDAGGLSVVASVLPSSIYYHGDRWVVDSDDVTLQGGDLRVDRFRLRNGRQSLVVDGGLSPDKNDTLSVRMDKFDISLLNSLLMKGKMDIKGLATGGASLVSPSKPSMALLAGIDCDSTYIAGRPMGSLQVTSVWNEPEKRFDFRLRNLLDDVRNFDIDGYLRPRDKAIRADATLNRLDMGYAAPLLAGIFDRFEGALDGQVKVDGTLDKLQIGSEGMQIVDGVLGVEFTQVPYHVSGPVSVDTEGLHFQNVTITDSSEGKGTVTGGLLFGGFKNMRMDTHLQFDRMKVLGITDRTGPIYGDVYGTGRVDITGPFDALALNIDARTVKSGNLHIPLRSGGAKATGNLLVFKQPYVEVEEDPYEQMLRSTRTGKKKTQSDLDVRVRVRATPAVTAFVDIGENTLQGLGNGLIDLRVRTGKSDQFTINGDYTLNSGEFKFSALDVVTREFTIRDGSSIRFNGDVMDSDLNVTGVYSTKASISTLLSGTASAESARRQVDCLLDITDKLRNPQIKFNIEIPQLDPGTEGLVSSALNTEDKMMKQFLYLLIANSFLPNEESGIITSGGSNMLYSNMTGIMAGQLNSIFERLHIPLDLGLNYQQNASGQNLFDVALSTQLFNNRVIVNGTIGNRRLLGTTTDEVAGDLDIDIKLNPPGTLRLNLFSHSADQYTSFLDNSQRNGVGFAYQREFNNIKQFFRYLFKPRQEREAMEVQPVERTYLQIDSTGQAHPLIDPPVHE